MVDIFLGGGGWVSEKWIFFGYDEIVDISFWVITLVNYFGDHLCTFQGFFKVKVQNWNSYWGGGVLISFGVCLIFLIMFLGKTVDARSKPINQEKIRGPPPPPNPGGLPSQQFSLIYATDWPTSLEEESGHACCPFQGSGSVCCKLELYLVLLTLCERFLCFAQWLLLLQCSHRLEKYLNIQDCLEKSLKNPQKALKSPWISHLQYSLNLSGQWQV